MQRVATGKRVAANLYHAHNARPCLPVRTTIPPQPLAAKQYLSTATSAQRKPEASSQADPQDKRSSLGRNAIIITSGLVIGWTISAYLRNSEDNSTTQFVKYRLVNKAPVSPTSAIFSLQPVHDGRGIALEDPRLDRAITSVEFKQPQLQIARSYTILPPSPDQSDGELRFLIRKERYGEVSGYLHRLDVGSEIDVRGPFVEAVLPESVQRVVFLAGGTGIVPALQVADALKEAADVHILWASRSREDCLGGISSNPLQSQGKGWWGSWWTSPQKTQQHGLSQELVEQSEKSTIVKSLEGMQVSRVEGAVKNHFQVDYFVDDERTLIKPNAVRDLLRQPSADPHEQSANLLFVSGPEGFINYWAGPKEWIDGREVQGPIRGELGKIRPTDWKIVKL